MEYPGLFSYLVRDGALTSEAIAPLLPLLPPERFVATAARGGEGLDSVRWPARLDADLARAAARRLGDPQVAEALAELERTGEDLPEVRARAAEVRTRLDGAAAAGDAVGADRFAVLHALYLAQIGALEGLYAYHAYRGLPGPGAEAAAHVVRRALQSGAMTPAELVGEAVALRAGAQVSGRPVDLAAAVLHPLVVRFRRACLDVEHAAGARCCTVIGETFAIPRLPADGELFVLAAGRRALLVLTFDTVPDWTKRVRAAQPPTLDLLEGEWSLVLPDDGLPPAEHAVRAVAALRQYVEVVLEAHLELHPEEQARFPVLEDAALQRIFGD